MLRRGADASITDCDVEGPPFAAPRRLSHGARERPTMAKDESDLLEEPRAPFLTPSPPVLSVVRVSLARLSSCRAMVETVLYAVSI